MDVSFPQTLIATPQEKKDPQRANSLSKETMIDLYFVLLFLLSAVTAPVPICTAGPLGKGWLWKINSGVRSTSVGLTITLAAESKAVFPLL